MDILLVNASVKNRSPHAGLNPPLGLGYLAAVLRKNGYTVSAIDFNLTGYNPPLFEQILLGDRPKMLGISAHTQTYGNGLTIAECAKRLLPDITVVMGGTHATIMYEQVVREPSIDVVALGEGEYTMLELAECRLRRTGDVNQVKGIAFMQDGRLRVTEDRPFIKDPDELPFPARELFPLPLYRTPAWVSMSRGGCPFNCRFCAVNNIWKGGVRFRSPEHVIREIDDLSQRLELNEISFADDTFTLNRRLVLKLCDLSEQLPFNWRWTCGTRVDLVDRELLQRMREAGCYRITYGVEAGSQQILDAIGKQITLDEVKSAVGMTLDAGIDVVCAFMFPHPEDTEETIREQGRFMRALEAMGASLTMSSTTPFPGTHLYENRDRLGLTILASSWDEFDAKRLVISTRNLSAATLESLLAELVQDLNLRRDE